MKITMILDEEKSFNKNQSLAIELSRTRDINKE